MDHNTDRYVLDATLDFNRDSEAVIDIIKKIKLLILFQKILGMD